MDTWRWVADRPDALDDDGAVIVWNKYVFYYTDDYAVPYHHRRRQWQFEKMEIRSLSVQ